MRVLNIQVESAAFNVPREIKKRRLQFAGIPESTVRGMLYVLLGQRPPSRYSAHESRFRIQWIDDIVHRGRYRYYAVGTKRQALPKIEEYFGRCKNHEAAKSVNISEAMIRSGAGQSFIAALEKVFGAKSVLSLFADFEKMAELATSGSEPHEKDIAVSQLEKLRLLEKQAKEIDPKTSWCLSPGYLSPFYSKWWVRTDTPFKGRHLIGIQGKPLKKYHFNIDILFPLESGDVAKVNSAILQGPKFASLGEGGLAWVNFPEDTGDAAYQAYIPESYQALNSNKTDLFFPEEAKL